jgi:hypothetical protein
MTASDGTDLAYMCNKISKKKKKIKLLSPTLKEVTFLSFLKNI